MTLRWESVKMGSWPLAVSQFHQRSDAYTIEERCLIYEYG